MSGQEWVPEPADLRGEARPLSPAVGPEPGFARPAHAPIGDEVDPEPVLLLHHHLLTLPSLLAQSGIYLHRSLRRKMI